MAVPTVKRLLEAWDQAARAPAWQRPILLLAAADPDLEPERAATLPLGERDARLLRLHEAIFGSQLTGVACCPQCNERLELTLNTADFNHSTSAMDESTHRVEVRDYQISFRFPTTLDLEAVSRCLNVEQGRLLILQRCVLSLQRHGKETPVADLPEELVPELEQRMAELDSNANVQLALACPNCHHHWSAPLDIGSFLWSELSAWAHKRLEEVHRLAFAYGWTEAEILQLSPLRRQYYLEATAL